jgi:anaerobic selenocysteine-containing dehydrogenase
MHPSDAKRLQIENGGCVEIRSGNGMVTGIVTMADDVRPGVVSVSHGFPNSAATSSFSGTSVSTLIDDETHYDPFSGMPRMSAIPVTVTRSSV